VLFSIAPELALVLDNCQEVGDQSSVHEILRTAGEEVPGGSRLILLSRADAPSTYSRLRANGHFGSIRWPELQLTSGEMIAVAALHGVKLTPDRADDWRRLSGGWVAGLRLLLEDAAGECSSRVPTVPGTALFDYFAEEVFRTLPARTRALLMSASVVPALDGQLAETLAGDTAAEQELERLVRRGYFTTRHGSTPPHYQFHPLFRAFLLRQAEASFEPAALTTLRRRAADLIEQQGRPDEAAALLVELEAWESLSALALRQARQLIDQGRHWTLEGWLRQIPGALRQANPWLSHWLGACLLLHDPGASLECFGHAYAQFLAQGEAGAGLLGAWSGTVDAIFHQYEDMTQMDAWLAEFDQRLRPIYADAPPDLQAKVAFSLFVALSFRQPEHAEMEIWAQRVAALERAAEEPGLRALLRLHLGVDRLWRGQVWEAAAMFESFRHRSIPQTSISPLARLIGFMTESCLAMHLAEAERSTGAADQGLEIADETDAHFWDTSLAWFGACSALNAGKLNSGRRFIDKVAARMDPQRTADRCYFYALSARWQMLHGEHPGALRHATVALESINRLGLPYFTSTWLLGMGWIAGRCENAALARQWLDEGLSIGQAMDNPILRTVGLLFRAELAFRQGEDGDAVPDLREAMALGARYGYRGFFFWPREVIALLCLRALELGIEPGYAEQLIRCHGLDVPPEGEFSDAWPWPLKVFTLGRFAVFVDGQEIHFAGKAQRAPMSLLKALVALGTTDVPEWKLIDTLWPEAEGDAGHQVLATTLHRLRKLIGGEMVRRQDGRLSLDLKRCWVDCRALDRALGDAWKGHCGALRARLSTLYRGPFLDGETDVPWAQPMRETLHVKLVRLLRDEGHLAEKAGRWDDAHSLYAFGSEIDSLLEEFHCGLMRCHLAQGQWAETVTVFRRCHRTLSSRLGVGPCMEATRLYLSAMKQSGRPINLADATTAIPSKRPPKLS
jgi:LuxR family transcriptional regulator, maltose regulon positive regulatory protein